MARFVAIGFVGLAVLSGGAWGVWRLRPRSASGGIRIANAATRHRAAPLTPIAQPMATPASAIAAVPPLPAARDSLKSNPVETAAIRPTPQPETAVRATPPNAADTGAAAENVHLFAKATTWANVRADRNLDSEIIGVVKPDSIVEIREVRGGWRRVSSAGLTGWVDFRLFSVVDSPPAKPR